MDVSFLRDFAWYTSRYWKVADKGGHSIPFVLNSAQRLVQDAADRQIKEKGYVRLNVLKARQVGLSTYCIARGTHYVMTMPHRAALTISHRLSLSQEWLRRCRAFVEQSPEYIRPHLGATNLKELWFDQLDSRYYVESIESSFPGMGSTISYLHMSEVGSWDKSPINKNPDELLNDLSPALPKGQFVRDTWIIRESTGKMRGDWWHREYYYGKTGDSDYESLFLPWFLAAEYCLADSLEVLERTPYENDLVREAKRWGIELTDAHLAWRRLEIRSEFHGDEERFAVQFPAYEEEAFLAPGQAVFLPEQIAKARETIRPPVWRGDIIPSGNPAAYRLDGSGRGNLLIWDHDPRKGEKPNPNYHFVLGADCRWGKKFEGTDWDVAYVECLETRKVCARIRGKYDLALWGRLLAALGYYYNTCPLAPERNTMAATALMPNVADWRYPNVWVRTDDVKLKGHKPQDYGWETTANSKGDIIAYAKAATMEGGFDWADELAVSEAESWVHNEKNGNPEAPAGCHDDALMARMITAYVAHRERFKTPLYQPPTPTVIKPRSLEERFREMLSPDEEEDYEEELVRPLFE